MKPMSGTKADLDRLKYPAYGSVKGDGIRVNIYDRLCRTKSLKPLPNIYTRTRLESYPVLEKLEAEITTVEDLADPESFNKATSAFMRHKGEPPLFMWIFDMIVEGVHFDKRWDMMQKLELPPFARILQQTKLENRKKVDDYIAGALEAGYEGVILRHGDSMYKFGTATVTEGQLLKVKPMEDAEGVLEGFEEGMINTNEKKTNELGRSKRSSAKAGLIPSGMVGTLLVRHPIWGIVRVAGIKDDLALDMFRNFPKYKGRLTTFKYQAHGTLDAPRIAKFKGFRSPDDMTLPD